MPDRLKLFIRARLGFAAIVLFIGFLDVYGRRLEKTFPVLISFIPFLAAAAFLAFVYLLLRRRSSFPPRATILKLSLPTAAAIAMAVLACESLIVLPIERIHVLKYTLLGICGFFSVRSQSALRRIVFAACACAAVGCLDETSQYFIPDRVFDPADMLLNWTGSAFGLLLGLLLERWRSEMRGPLPE